MCNECFELFRDDGGAAVSATKEGLRSHDKIEPTVMVQSLRQPSGDGVCFWSLS